MRPVSFITINSFHAIPVTRYIIGLIPGDRCRVAECHFQGDPIPVAPGNYTAIGTFPNRKAFNSQSISFKLLKYLRLGRQLLSSIRTGSVLYLIDFQLLAVLTLLRAVLRMGRSVPVVYHQFELIDPTTLTPLNRIIWSLALRSAVTADLCIFPETNRRDYFCRLAGVPVSSTWIMPNTCSAQPVEPPLPASTLPLDGGESVVVGHIGQLGPDHYYREFAELIRRCVGLPISFLVIGGLSPKVEGALRSVENPNLTLLGQIPHEQLAGYYQKIDFGLILYKGVDLCFEYCAPNKLYEYWSHGIKVIAHPLTGLLPVFSDPVQGSLVDLAAHDAFERITATLLAGNPDRDRLRSLFREQFGIEHHLPELNRRLLALQTP
jgi:glycosyltransferase involved in cell wall biosynthesis